MRPFTGKTLTPYQKKWNARFHAWSHGEPIRKPLVYSLRKCCMAFGHKASGEGDASIVDYFINLDRQPRPLGFRIGKEQEEQGIAWLRSQDLSARCNIILAGFTHFTLTGYVFSGGNIVTGYMPRRGVPVYRVHGRNGWFDYSYEPWVTRAAWQDGDGIVVHSLTLSQSGVAKLKRRADARLASKLEV
jgi:hypothetical protein